MPPLPEDEDAPPGLMSSPSVNTCPTPRRDRRGPFTFRRPILARQVAEALLGDGPFAERSGMFLAAPRGTGKTTFLVHDLVPEVEARRAVPVHADLSAERARDPGQLIADAIGEALRAAAGRRRWLGFRPRLPPDINHLGTPTGATLPAALLYLADRTRRPVVLILDEAQRAADTEGGLTALFALKSARDTLNAAGAATPRLALLLVGSDRDGMARLVHRHDSPFFGARVADFPPLGRDFAEAYAAWLNARRAPDEQLDPETVFAAFAALGHCPGRLAGAYRDGSAGRSEASR